MKNYQSYTSKVLFLSTFALILFTYPIHKAFSCETNYRSEIYHPELTGFDKHEISPNSYKIEVFHDYDENDPNLMHYFKIKSKSKNSYERCRICFSPTNEGVFETNEVCKEDFSFDHQLSFIYAKELRDFFSDIRWSFRPKLSLKPTLTCEYIRPGKAPKALPFSEKEFTAITDSLMKFLDDAQIKETRGEKCFAGEWGSSMYIRSRFFTISLTLGPQGKWAYDSNCFETLETHNILAQLYLEYGKENPSFNKIPALLDRSIEKISRCKGEYGFGFWPETTVDEKWQDERTPSRMRGPILFKYLKKWARLQANVTDDSDDTALAHLAYDLYDKVRLATNQDNPYKNHLDDLPGLGDVVSEHRVDGSYFQGAFGTWFGKSSSTFWALGDVNRVIPLNNQVVDCVVNARILGNLDKLGQYEGTEGVQEACDYLNRQVRERAQSRCGAYYPNKYSLHHMIGLMDERVRTSCLHEESLKTLINDIEKSQLTDGSWETYRIYKDDVIQTTANALSAYIRLLNLDTTPPTLKQKEVLSLGLRFLWNYRIELDERTIFWPAGHHFAGGPVSPTDPTDLRYKMVRGSQGLRHRLIWKSTGYTNAVILDLFQRSKSILLGNN